MSEKQLYTTDEAAQMVGLKYDTVRKLLSASGQAPTSQIGNNKLWTKYQIARALKKQVTK